MDLKVHTGTGEWIDIEMQMSAYDAYRKRSLYYWASLYKDSLQKAERYHELKKCIVISIMNNKFFHETTEYHNCFWITEKKKHFPLNEDLELHFIELESFDDTREVVNLTELERWVMYLKDEGIETKNEKLQQIMAEEEAIEMANQVFNEVTADDRMRELVLSIENAKRDQASREYEAELKGRTEGIELGERQGIEKGKRQGIEQGKRQGIEQGILAGKIETAKALLLDGATVDFVVKMTKLDLALVEKLQKEI